jgi:hypothetical protein
MSSIHTHCYAYLNFNSHIVFFVVFELFEKARRVKCEGTQVSGGF